MKDKIINLKKIFVKHILSIYLSIKRVLIGTERGVLLWDPRSSYQPAKSNDKPTLKLVSGIENSIRTLSGNHFHFLKPQRDHKI